VPQPPHTPPPPWPAQAATPRGPSRLPIAVALVIAIAALAVAVGAWFRPMPKAETPATKVYSEQEVADAKKAVCDAFAKSQDALKANSRRAAGNPENDLAVVANSRIAIQASSVYLKSRLMSQPATPNDLAAVTRQLAELYEAMVLDQTAEIAQTALDADYRNADSLTGQIAQACK